VEGPDGIGEAADFIRSRIGTRPRLVIVLGSGLGALAERAGDSVAVPYADIPHFPASTSPGHAGRLVSGRLAGAPVLFMQGRFHYYEGHSVGRIAFPVRTFRRLGIEYLIATNAAGGVNRDFAPGDLMLITDHINLCGQNPLVGPNDESIGVRFPDMSRAYDPLLREIAARAAAGLGIGLRTGVYAWFAGPSFETPAEIRMARVLGADAVGMSTVPEVIAAVHCGIKVLGISCITNMAAGILDQPITEEEVLAISERKRPVLASLVEKTVGAILAGAVKTS